MYDKFKNNFSHKDIPNLFYSIATKIFPFIIFELVGNFLNIEDISYQYQSKLTRKIRIRV